MRKPVPGYPPGCKSYLRTSDRMIRKKNKSASSRLPSFPGMNPKTYQFAYSATCNMCGAGATLQKFFGRRLDQRQGYRPKRTPGISVSIFRCRSCGLIYPNPMPIPEKLEQHYDIPPEKYWNKEHETDHFSRQIDSFKKLSQRAPESCSALDIGAGIGNSMIALARAGFDVYGIEPSPSFRRTAIERMGVSEMRLQMASVETANFAEDRFDFINFAAVLEHLTDPAAALEKAVRWLKRDRGLIYVEVPSSAFLLSRMVRWFYRFTGAGDYVINTCPMHAPFHLYEFGLESFLRHGMKSGYRVAFHEFHPIADYIPHWAKKPFNALMKWTRTGMQLAVWLRKI